MSHEGIICIVDAPARPPSSSPWSLVLQPHILRNQHDGSRRRHGKELERVLLRGVGWKGGAIVTPEVVWKSRGETLDQMVECCAKGTLQFSGPNSLLEYMSNMGWSTRYAYEAVRNKRTELGL